MGHREKEEADGNAGTLQEKVGHREIQRPTWGFSLKLDLGLKSEEYQVCAQNCSTASPAPSREWKDTLTAGTVMDLVPGGTGKSPQG